MNKKLLPLIAAIEEMNPEALIADKYFDEDDTALVGPCCAIGAAIKLLPPEARDVALREITWAEEEGNPSVGQLEETCTRLEETFGLRFEQLEKLQVKNDNEETRTRKEVVLGLLNEFLHA